MSDGGAERGTDEEQKERQAPTTGGYHRVLPPSFGPGRTWPAKKTVTRQASYASKQARYIGYMLDSSLRVSHAPTPEAVSLKVRANHVGERSWYRDSS
jgi:hypothetical protein